MSDSTISIPVYSRLKAFVILIQVKSPHPKSTTFLMSYFDMTLFIKSRTDLVFLRAEPGPDCGISILLSFQRHKSYTILNVDS